jgi:hypothetical protein
MTLSSKMKSGKASYEEVSAAEKRLDAAIDKINRQQIALRAEEKSLDRTRNRTKAQDKRSRTVDSQLQKLSLRESALRAKRAPLSRYLMRF